MLRKNFDMGRLFRFDRSKKSLKAPDTIFIGVLGTVLSACLCMGAIYELGKLEETSNILYFIFGGFAITVSGLSWYIAIFQKNSYSSVLELNNLKKKIIKAKLKKKTESKQTLSTPKSIMGFKHYE